MSYQLHKFSSLHLARILGSGGTFVTNSGMTPDTADPDAPVSRLYDDQTKRLVTAEGDGIRVWYCDSNVSDTLPSSWPAINRLIMPQPHSLRTEGIAFKVEWCITSGAWTGVETDGAVLVWGGCPDDVVFDFDAEAAKRYYRVHFYDGYQASSRVQLGELIWTHTAAPATGIVHTWEHPAAENNADVTRTMGGDTFFAVRGPALRSFSVQHRAVTGDDLKVYDALFRDVGTITPFYYDHSDGADWKTTILTFAESGIWTATNGSGGFANGIDGTASDARYITSTASGTCAIRRSMSEYADLRDCYLSVDVKLSTTAPITTDADLLIELEDTVSGGHSRWSFGRPVIGSQLNDTWYRLFIDPTDAPSAIVASTGLPVDLRYVDRIKIGFDATAGSQTMTLDNLIAWKRAAAPVRVRFARPMQRKQDHPAPSVSTPSYTIDMDLVEVTG